MQRLYFLVVFFFTTLCSSGQLNWQNVDSLFQPLPKGVHVYRSTDLLDGKPNIAYYVAADLKNKELQFKTDTSYKRRLTPTQFYERNSSPLIVVNTTFFSFETNQNLNTVISNGKLVSHNKPVAGRGKDTLKYHHTLNSVIGISKKRKADVAWVYTDSSAKYPLALQQPVRSVKSEAYSLSRKELTRYLSDTSIVSTPAKLKKWKVQTAVGGGPVLLQDGNIRVTNEEERKFAGKAINDKHPRTAMGYTNDDKLIILVVQGRFPGEAEGATLVQMGQILKDIGCVEALNLDGGGSSCLLVNGKETIVPSDNKKQRAVPAVFIIQERK